MKTLKEFMLSQQQDPPKQEFIPKFTPVNRGIPAIQRGLSPIHYNPSLSNDEWSDEEKKHAYSFMYEKFLDDKIADRDHIEKILSSAVRGDSKSLMRWYSVYQMNAKRKKRSYGKKD